MERATIRLATPADLPAIDTIYDYYVRTSTCTYQEEPDQPDVRREWFAAHGERYPVTVIERDCEILGWASLSPWKERSGYRFTVELSVYLRDDTRGQGLGKRLLADLVERAAELGYHAIIGGASSEQVASIRLHESLGFTRVAHFLETGFKFGKWLDVVYYQKRLGPGLM